MTTVFLNGRFLTDTDAATVSAFDAGFQHGVGLFETMLGGVSPGTGGDADGEPWVLHLDRHMDRLAASARDLSLSQDLRAPALSEAVVETVRRSGLARTRVRLTVTGGDLSLLARPGVNGGGSATAVATRRQDPTVLIVAQPATDYPAAMFERGVGVTLADTRANPLNPFEGHKTLNYWWRLRELQVAAAKGAGEAVILGVTNHVCGGCVSNLFLVKGGALLTPIARGEEQDVAGTTSVGSGAKVLPSPVLPGITRGWILEQAEFKGLSTTRRMLSVQDLVDADEVFLTNSSWGVLPVVKVEANAIGDAVPGRLTKTLRDAWLAQLAS